MRTKEVDNAINHLKDSCFDELEQEITEKSIDTVLNYISDLEKTCKKQEDRIIEDDIPKQMIRDKIKELDDYYKKEVYPIRYQWADIDITEFYDSQIELLNELLEN